MKNLFHSYRLLILIEKHCIVELQFTDKCSLAILMLRRMCCTKDWYWWTRNMSMRPSLGLFHVDIIMKFGLVRGYLSYDVWSRRTKLWAFHIFIYCAKDNFVEIGKQIFLCKSQRGIWQQCHSFSVLIAAHLWSNAISINDFSILNFVDTYFCLLFTSI